MRRQFWATVFCLGVLFPSFINSQKVQAQKLDIENNYSLVPVSSFSFNSPFYLVRGTIPFWKFGGDAVVTDDYLRLTPAEKSRNGWIFGTKPYPFESWSVEIKFKIGGGGSLGADGMAFWYTESPQVTGSTPVFGVHDTWKGLGVIFDTFDNDRQGNNPYVSVLYNDGTWTYEPQTDGSNRELGGCKLNYRNWDSRARITYIDGVLQVEVIVPTISSEWTLCTSVPVNLPPGHFFGLSAATGGLVDNHDVMGFSTSRIMPKGVEPTEEDTKKFEEIQRKKIKPVMSAGVFSPVSDRVADEEPQEQQERQEQKQEQQTGSNDLKGLKNRAQTITTTLKNSIHEYEDTTSNEKPQQTYTPPVQQQTNTANTYTTPPQGGDLVQVLINEINLLKNQQTTLQNSLSSLQNNVNSFVNNNRKNVEDLNNLLSTQQKLSESLDRLLITAPTKEDIKQAGSSAPSALDTQVQQLIRLVGEVKSVLNDKLNQNVENTNRQIESLVRTVNEMRGKVEQTRSSQSQIEASIRTNTQEMSETIERSTSWGFWIYFLLFQAVFGIAFMWWKKYRDDNNKKFL